MRNHLLTGLDDWGTLETVIEKELARSEDSLPPEAGVDNSPRSCTLLAGKRLGVRICSADSRTLGGSDTPTCSRTYAIATMRLPVLQPN
jgi:hypothetical protein